MTQARPQESHVDPPDIDAIIHQPARLLFVANLYAAGKADFSFLKRSTRLTDGNLSTHLAALERAGFVEIEKGFRGKKPRTKVSQTPEGRRALDNYIKLLEGILTKAK